MSTAAPRILQVCAVDFTAYHFLRSLMRGCRGAGWAVDLACADGPFAARLRAEGFHHRRLPISRSVSPLRNLAATMTLAISMRTHPVDLVHTHTPIGGIVGRAAATASGRAAIVHTFHGLPFPGHPRSRAERAFLAIERALARRTAHFFSQAAGDAERAVALGIARRDRLTVIGNGVDLERFRPDADDRAAMRREIGIDRNDVVVTSVSRLVREKGLLELAAAAEGMHSRHRVHVLVVGAALPSDRDPVEAELSTHPVVRSSSVRWRRLGHRDDVERLLRASDIFVLPSHREGLPRSVIEALASGLPVVASDIPACRELVDASMGMLFPVGDVGALREALTSLADDSLARAELGRRARARALERHDERRIVDAQIAVFRALLR
jgi:glycosyltransferase involved in cell wall biosynthesis